MSRLGFVLAAVLVVAGGVACGEDDRGTVTPSTSDAATTTTTAVSEEIDYTKPGAGRIAGTGFVVETSLDGTGIYVQEEDPAFPEPGCEGQPSPVLFRLPVAGGDRELLATRNLPLRGSAERGPDGQFVLRDGCEGFLSNLYVGTETPAGRLAGMVVVPDPNPDQDRLTLSSVTWSLDGKFLVGADNGPRPGGGRWVVRIDPATGQAFDIFEVTGFDSDVFQVAELATGAYAVATTGTVEIRSATGERLAPVDGNGFAISPDRRMVAVHGAGLSLLTVDDLAPQVLVAARGGRQIDSVVFSPGGEAVAYVTSNEGGSDNELSVVTLADRKVTLATVPAMIGRPFFTGDGLSLVFNRFYPAPRFVPDVMVVTFG